MIVCTSQKNIPRLPALARVALGANSSDLRGDNTLARRSTKSDPTKSDKSTLYCNFCGKSQYEVNKLIAGPTVFICDECVALCDDIIWNESESRMAIRIKVAFSTAIDNTLFEAIASIINEQFQNYEVKYEFFQAPTDSANSASFALFTAAKFPADETDAQIKESAEKIREMAQQLSVLRQKFIHENEKAKALLAELNELKIEYVDFLRSTKLVRKGPVTELRVVMFLDISGFSQLEEQMKQKFLDMLRGLSPALIEERGANQINMWGDAIVANFVDVNVALECAIKFLRHIDVEGYTGRIGMSWGSVRIKFNSATGKLDVDGNVVDYAARLEPLAPTGGILLSQEFGALNVRPELGTLIPLTVEVKKAFQDYKVGDTIDVFQFEFKRN